MVSWEEDVEISLALRLEGCAGRVAVERGGGGRAVATLGGGVVLNGCGCRLDPLIKPVGSGFLNADDIASSK